MLRGRGAGSRSSAVPTLITTKETVLLSAGAMPTVRVFMPVARPVLRADGPVMAQPLSLTHRDLLIIMGGIEEH